LPFRWILINIEKRCSVKKVVPFLLLTVLIAVYGGLQVIQSATDIVKQVGISEEEAGDFVWWNLSGESFSYPRSAELKQKSGSEKATMVKEIFAYAKKYSQSESFKEKYREARENSRPQPPEKPEPVEEMRSRMKKEGQASIAEMEKSVASMAKDQQEMLKPTIEMMKEQVKSYDDPDNPMFSKDMEKMMIQGYEMQMEQHKKAMAEWEQKNPDAPTAMIKRRLEKFLEETKDVDFNAKLVDGRVFANREYEMKPSNWKMCYRAGREPVEAARAYVTEWLKELK
jgi:hypothetical protein